MITLHWRGAEVVWDNESDKDAIEWNAFEGLTINNETHLSTIHLIINDPEQ